jgi:hypothetical protein
MAMYFYLGALCKNHQCENLCALRFFGTDSEQIEPEDAMPTSFIYECAQCRQSHRYEREETFVFMANSAPPLGWQDGWW